MPPTMIRKRHPRSIDDALVRRSKRLPAPSTAFDSSSRISDADFDILASAPRGRAVLKPFAGFAMSALAFATTLRNGDLAALSRAPSTPYYLHLRPALNRLEDPHVHRDRTDPQSRHPEVSSGPGRHARGHPRYP